jgi:glycosyltransferase involved in cell wall biosynthesis
MKTLIVMPARNENEAETIGAVIGRLKAIVPDADILVINDASTDNTAEVAAKAGAKVVNLPINLGYGGAVQTGFKYAARHDYDAVVLMDADGQHDPACVPDLLKALQDADFVLGSRFLGECRYKVPIARRIGMWLFGKIVNWVTGQKITDPTSGFQALRKEVVKFLAEDNYPVDFPDADVLVLLHQSGFPHQRSSRHHARAPARRLHALAFKSRLLCLQDVAVHLGNSDEKREAEFVMCRSVNA